ncbi:MAG: WD40 repeat domain-containing protein, partial [Planctomycetota bacterium]
MLAHDRAASRVAAAHERAVTVFARDGATVASFSDHPSTVTGVAFSPDGTRLATSHYNGLSLWSLSSLAKPERLTWAGSMTGVSWSPDGRFVIAQTQERELHAWDLETGRDYRLGGYQRKVHQIAWSFDSAWLLTSGADMLVAWPFTSDPGSVPPREIGYADRAHVTAVAPLSRSEQMVAGFSYGQILVGEATKGTAKIARAPTGAAITCIAVDLGKDVILFGTRDGKVGKITVKSGSV